MHQTGTSPIAVFAYNRLDHLQETISALRQCTLADESELFIFCDGPREKDIAAVRAVRDYIKTIEGFKRMQYRFSESNKGLANSIIQGVTEILETYDSIIVLEDDLVTSTNFLSFMNQAVRAFKKEQKVFSIAGYTMPIKLPDDYPYDNYFTGRASSWGWATWKNRWEQVDWHVSDYRSFSKNPIEQRRFNRMGSDLSGMLKSQMNGEISSWAIRWCYHQFKNDFYTVYPTVSKIVNIGFGEQATHTSSVNNRFATNLDVAEKHQFNFQLQPMLMKPIIHQFTAIYSLKTRIYYKIKAILGM
ncbi:glycosyltransferase family 2 protein [Flavobacteriaceae bacterium TP-CH-4]|uniref:Glycosyltransferase family 2 protein n=1 Tax=Pelagihabitans pacificus TaxID=2696054 RepID=A0A967AVW7_9FLAO|nr:sugar phosphate nucleotidyltransferase [Pelagihabitans pacificus]NHF61379.1 glycosyltransferase family 2 protein [Pelagihabitans pacificus]